MAALLSMRRLHVATFAVAVAVAGAARAAGGHFDVDDAYVLEPGHCQVETWLIRSTTANVTDAHVGPSCRAGPVELGANLDRISAGDGASVFLGPQVKWVTGPRREQLSAGAVYAVAVDLRHGGTLQTLYVPVSWNPVSAFWLHGNLGGDQSAGQRTWRYGASAEWAASEHATFIGERIRVLRGWTSRLGARYTTGGATSLDISVARIGYQASPAFAIGLNREFGR